MIITTDSQHYNDIASAIGEHTGKKYKPAEMAQGVAEVYAAGEAAGHDAGVEDGKSAAWNEFWDKYQKNGTRMAYNYAFAGIGWTNETFRPKYDMDIDSASTMFAHSGIKNFKSCCEAAGISVSFAKCTNFVNFMNWNDIEVLPAIDVGSCSAIASIFSGAYKLRWVDKLILNKNGTNTFAGSSFSYCSELQHIIFEGVLGTNGLDVSPCAKLTKESLMSIINVLKNYAGSGTAYTVTLGATNLAKLTDAEKAIATQKGWTLA